MEKKNQILFIVVGVLLVIVIGVTFAYFTTGVTIEGSGGSISGETAELMKVKYDAGTSTLNADNLTPGHSSTKGFKVTITPGSDTSTATYRIYLNITENTFTKCNDTNYDDITNACAKGAEELIYRLKDSNGNILKTGDLTGITGEVELIRETKTAVSQTDYNYTLEIEFKETNADQNHNQNKTINGEVKVEFAERVITKEDILASLTKATRPNFETLTENTTGTIYQAEDDDGTSYYYAGAVDNNWVKFAGLYWRIIRFNGDGTIRLIYNGVEPVQTGEGTQIGTSAFNEQNNDNAYIGYMYGTPGSDTYESTHANTNNSTIKIVVDNWYKTNINDAGFSAKVDTNAGFCGDRDNYTNEAGTTSGGGTGTTATYYGAFTRFVPDSVKNNPTPTLKCKNASDLYTVSGASKGNKSLTYPVGLITADEVNAAGAVYGTANSSYYLYTNSLYWTMSPSYYGGGAVVFNIDSTGFLGAYWVTSTWGVRPVINLKANTLFIGNGTSSNPYVVLN